MLLRPGRLIAHPPTFTPALDLIFAGAAALDSRITFTRATTATFFDSTGTLQTASSGTARLDYDPATLAARGLLIEEARTNYALWTRDLTNAAWTASNVTTAKTATGIDGTANSATTLTASAGNGTVLQAITRGSAARITSAYIKRRTGSGVVNMTQDNGSTWTVVTVTGAWTRVSIPSATAANPTIGFRIVTNADAVDVDYVQHEEGAFITSAIATTTVAVARNAEVATVAISAFAFNAGTGTFAVDGMVEALTATNQICIQLDDGTANNRFFVFIFATTGAPGTYSTVGGVATSGQPAGATTALTAFKIGMSYAPTANSGCINGGAVTASAPASQPTVTTLRLGANSVPAGYLNGWLGRVRIYGNRLSDARLKALTA